jgi:hypothetical protein
VQLRHGQGPQEVEQPVQSRIGQGPQEVERPVQRRHGQGPQEVEQPVQSRRGPPGKVFAISNGQMSHRTGIEMIFIFIYLSQVHQLGSDAGFTLTYLPGYKVLYRGKMFHTRVSNSIFIDQGGRPKYR